MSLPFWRKRRAAADVRDQPHANPFEALRRQALNATPELARFDPATSGRSVYGALLDWGLDSGLATLVALDDGTASLYLSTGGGVIGGGFHGAVSEAAKRFVLSFEPLLESMAPDAIGEPPSAGESHLRALTTRGRLVAGGLTEELAGEQHPMSAPFRAAQALITELRTVSQREPGGAEGPP